MRRVLTQERLPWVAVSAAALAMAWLRYRYLAATPEPTGIDGYYYPIQIRALAETGHLYYPSPPLVLWLMRCVAAVTGDAIAAAKLTAAFGTALVAVPVMGLGRSLGARPWPAAAAAVLAGTAPSGSYLAAEFVKNGVALTVCGFFLWSLSAAIAAPSRRRIAGAIALLAATALAHKLALTLACFIAAPTLIACSRRRWLWLAVAALSAAIIAAAGALSPTHFPSLSSSALLAELWTDDWRLDFAIYRIDGAPMTFAGDVLIAALSCAALVAVRMARKPVPPLLLVAAAWTLLVANPFIEVADADGLGPRLRLTAFLAAAPCAGFLLSTATSRLRGSVRTALCLGVITGLLLARARVEPPGISRPNPRLLAALERLPAELTTGRVVIAPERALVFATVWVTRAPSQLRPEGVAPERRVRLVPFWFMDAELSTALRAATTDPPPGIDPPISLDPKHELALVAVTERTWQWLLASLSNATAERMREWPTI